MPQVGDKEPFDWDVNGTVSDVSAHAATSCRSGWEKAASSRSTFGLHECVCVCESDSAGGVWVRGGSPPLSKHLSSLLTLYYVLKKKEKKKSYFKCTTVARKKRNKVQLAGL